jgi:antitoxin (DNA-binding transcriptional repressor) of toxin-antitoxin stability system
VRTEQQEANMMTVTVAEARENLAELLQRVAKGEQIVITDGDRWLAALTQPARVIGYTRASPEEEAAAIARAEAQVRLWTDRATGVERHPGSAIDRDTIQRWLDEQRR